MANNASRILFIALDTFSQMGGIQRFNQRIIESLGKLAATGRVSPKTLIMRDTTADMPAGLDGEVTPFGANRAGFLRQGLAAARG
ncbi:hypothetical protein, partial [Pseudophaeobacter sp.]|uniref:hypothetical protein n=1 Tax=Pseudophaeobacter sp. TaxID=1971739 RepID=UPI0032995266